jgi:hypothetical protein
MTPPFGVWRLELRRERVRFKVTCNEGWEAAETVVPHLVIPARSGIQATVAAFFHSKSTQTVAWIPACAGMTSLSVCKLTLMHRLVWVCRKAKADSVVVTHHFESHPAGRREQVGSDSRRITANSVTVLRRWLGQGEGDDFAVGGRFKLRYFFYLNSVISAKVHER